MGISHYRGLPQPAPFPDRGSPQSPLRPGRRGGACAARAGAGRPWVLGLGSLPCGLWVSWSLNTLPISCRRETCLPAGFWGPSRQAARPWQVPWRAGRCGAEPGLPRVNLQAPAGRREVSGVGGGAGRPPHRVPGASGHLGPRRPPDGFGGPALLWPCHHSSCWESPLPAAGRSAESAVRTGRGSAFPAAGLAFAFFQLTSHLLKLCWASSCLFSLSLRIDAFSQISSLFLEVGRGFGRRCDEVCVLR